MVPSEENNGRCQPQIRTAPAYEEAEPGPSEPGCSGAPKAAHFPQCCAMEAAGEDKPRSLPLNFLILDNLKMRNKGLGLG